MRRERLTTILVVLATALAVAVVAPGAARAASPSEICQDLADGTLNGSYSAADLAAYAAALQNDPTLQGYCSPLPAVPSTPQCTEVAANTAGAVQASNGKWYANAPNGNAQACVHGAAAATTAPPSTPPTSGVAGASKTKTASAARPAASPRQATAAPLSATHTSGTLPFTGLQLTIFAIVGLALVAGGALLRLSTRGKSVT